MYQKIYSFNIPKVLMFYLLVRLALTGPCSNDESPACGP